MKERPILFSAPMVRAILECRKTQTRRVVQSIGNDEGFVIIDYGNGGWPYRSDDGDSTTHTIKRGGKLYLEETPHACPYGQPGDRLWVRETHMLGLESDIEVGAVAYKADGYVRGGLGDFEGRNWRPSIHMPRWASRILLEITSVRVERLQDISEADAEAEGPPKHFNSSRDNFCALWQEINGDGSWDANPWVWVIEFRQVKGGA